MFKFIPKRKARKYIKQLWTAHQRLMADRYHNPYNRADDIRQFAEAVAELAWLTGAAIDCSSPDEWFDD